MGLNHFSTRCLACITNAYGYPKTAVKLPFTHLLVAALFWFRAEKPAGPIVCSDIDHTPGTTIAK